MEQGNLGKKYLYLLLLSLLPSIIFVYFTAGKGILNIKFYYTSKLENKSLIPTFEGERFVHIDLKGAPPRISYYKDFFPILSKLGATGILIEYEDMFPYSGEVLKYVRAHNSYSAEDIITINSIAAENNLTVIPLVQTFGHLEYLLKLKDFSFLREVKMFPQVICPTHNMTLNILFEMIKQIVQAHPRSSMIHLGADEVYQLGKCDRCKHIMHKENISRHQLFLRHIKRISTHVKTNYQNIKVLMWDDEFRAINTDDLYESGISSLIEPVIWKYKEDVYYDLGYELFSKYSNVFERVWFASAFKGATGENQYITPILYHIANHQSWMEVYNDLKYQISIQGIFITGWQRYSHFQGLCELLPIGIPSLAFSLSVLLGFSANMTLDVYPDVIKDVLKCRNPLALTEYRMGIPYCAYPGGDILDALTAFHQFMKKYETQTNDYTIHYNLSYPNHTIHTSKNLTNLLDELTSIEGYITKTMLKVFDEYTVLEWKQSFVQPVYNKINRKVEALNRLDNIS